MVNLRICGRSRCGLKEDPEDLIYSGLFGVLLPTKHSGTSGYDADHHERINGALQLDGGAALTETLCPSTSPEQGAEDPSMAVEILSRALDRSCFLAPSGGAKRNPGGAESRLRKHRTKGAGGTRY